MEIRTCSTCRFWSHQAAQFIQDRGWCKKLELESDVVTEDQGAIITDMATVLTLPTFGCTMHEQK
jgi:hypothetical protein